MPTHHYCARILGLKVAVLTGSRTGAWLRCLNIGKSPQTESVAGTSAGAISATLTGLYYSFSLFRLRSLKNKLLWIDAVGGEEFRD